MSDFTLADYKIQAYLLANAVELAEKTGRLSSPDQTNNPQNLFIRKAVNDQNTTSTLNELLANSTTEKEKLAFIDELPSYAKSNLSPYVNIYKTFVDGDKEVDIRLEPGRNLSDDPDAVMSAGTSQIPGTNELSNPGVNIESVEIVRLGGNPAEIDTNITFKLTLRALRLGHYFDRQKSTPKNTRQNFEGPIPEKIQNQLDAGVAWIDLIKINLFEQEAIKSNPNFNAVQSLLYKFAKKYGADFKQTLFEDLPENNYDEVKAKIKVEIGYEPLTEQQMDAVVARMPYPINPFGGAYAGPIDPDDLAIINAERKQKIATMIEQQKQVFFLNLVQNEIGYDAKDGAQLSIDFVAAGAMATTTRKTDLLFDPNFFEEELRLNDARCRILKKMPHSEGSTIVNQNQFGANRTGPGFVGPNSLNAIIIDPFVNVTGVLFEGEATARGLRNGTVDLDQYEDEVKTGVLDSNEAKSDALNKIQNSIDKLGQIQRNLLINGLYGAAQLVANNEDDDRVKNASFDTQFAQAGETPRFKSRVYMHFAKTDHVLNYIASFLSPSSTSNASPYIQNFGDLYFFSEENLAGATDNDITQSELERYVQDLGTPRSEEDLIEDFTDDDVSNIISGDEVNIEFTFLGDIIETALEVLAANNRFGEGDLSPVQRVFGRSKNLIYAGSNIDKVAKTAFIEPFYWSTQNLGVGDTIDRIKELQKILGDIIMGDVTYQNPADPNQEVTINLADLPISMLEYKKWFANNIGGTRRSNFFIKDYINSLIRWVSRLVGDAVNYNRTQTTNREPPELISNKVFLNLRTTDNISPFGTVVFESGAKNSNDKSISALSMDEIINVANTQDQSVLSPKLLTLITQTPSPSLPLPLGTNRRDRDRNNNIPHVILNDSGKGALRRINFSREDMPGLREARLFQGEDFAGTSLLREKYNSQVEFEGNNFFKPGTVLYIEPGAVDLGYTDDANSFARQLGLGGYYYVIRVTHSLYFAGKLDWQTSIDTKWQSFGDEFVYEGTLPGVPSECETSYLARYGAAIDLDDPTQVSTLQSSMDAYFRALKRNIEDNR